MLVFKAVRFVDITTGVKIEKRRVLRLSPALRNEEHEEELIKKTKIRGRPKECIILQTKWGREGFQGRTSDQRG